MELTLNLPWILQPWMKPEEALEVLKEFHEPYNYQEYTVGSDVAPVSHRICLRCEEVWPCEHIESVWVLQERIKELEQAMREGRRIV